MTSGFENESADFNLIGDPGLWVVEDVFWMLFGERGLSSIKSQRCNLRYRSDPRIRMLLGDLIVDLRSMRFGSLNPDESQFPLFPLMLSIHPLKIIDWLKDERILEKAESWGYSTHQDFQRLIDYWESDRESIEAEFESKPDYKKLASRCIVLISFANCSILPALCQGLQSDGISSI